MVKVEVEQHISASLEHTWAMFSNFGDLSWVPGTEKMEVIGEGIGMIRRMHLEGIEPFDEILLTMDHDACSYSYQIPRNAVVPFDNYVAEVFISGDANDSKVVWKSSFEEGDMDPAAARELIAGNYQMMLDKAAEKLTA